jgi:putative membrane protein
MNAVSLAWHEFRQMFRRPFMWVVAAAIACIPLLYACLYLWAFWDPYGLINHLPAAVVVEDQGGVQDGKQKNVGEDFANEVKTDTNVEWHITDRADAETGLENGKYFFVLYVPADFTRKVLTASEAHPQAAELIYKANPSTNFLASSIAKRVASEVRTKLAEKVSGQYFTAMLKGVQDGAAGLNKAADAADKLADGTGKALDGSTKLQDGTGQLHAGATQLAQGTQTAQAGAAALYSGAQQAQQGASKLAAGAGQAQQGVSKLAAGADSLQTGAIQLQQGLGSLGTGISSLHQGLTALQTGLNDPQKGIPALSGGMAKVQEGTTQLQQGVTGGISQIQAGVGQSAQAVASAQAILQAMAQQNPALAADPQFQQALALVSGANQGLNSQIVPGLEQLNQQVAAGFAQVQAGQAQVAGGIQQLESQASGALTQLSAGATQLQQGAGALQQGAGKLAAGASQLNTGANALQAGLTDLSSGTNQLAGGLGNLTTGAGKLANGLTDLNSGANRLAGGLGDLKVGTNQLTSGLRDLTAGSKTLAEKLGDAAKEMADAAKGNPDQKGEALADPVHLNEVNIHEVKEYGTGLTPYFLSLGLWVGAMMLFFVIRARDMRATLSSLLAPFSVLAKYLVFAALGVVQALLASVVLLYGLGLHVEHLAQFYAFNIMLSLVFVAVFQFLVSAFGLAGRFLGIVILMLQLTSAGGTFPTQMLPGFFQKIHPFMPMTYAVEGLRHLVSGSSTIAFGESLAVLVGIGVISLLLAMLTAPRFVTLADLRPNRDLAM